MAAALVSGQTAGGSNVGLTATATLPGTSTTGNFISVLVSEYPGTTPNYSIADGGTNTWNAGPSITTDTAKLQLFYAYNITGKASHAITVTSDQSGSLRISVAEFSGVETASDPIDKTATGADFDSNVTSGSTATLAQADELVIGGMMDVDLANITAGADSFTKLTEVDAGETHCDEYKVVAATTAVFASFTCTGIDSAIALVATFRAAAGGGGGTNPKGPLGNPFSGPFGGAI